MKKEHPKQSIYDKAEEERESQSKEILGSRKEKKIIVAAPGTGKTHLFQEMLKTLKTKSEDALTLTFVNALVDELSLSLLGLSEVRTLHGYALKILNLKEKKYALFPKLPEVIQEDAEILKREKVNFKSLFQLSPIDEDLLHFYKKRQDYYGEYYGFSDIIYTLVRYFEDPRNQKEIPSYKQILVDEFQDFNEFEVRLIELLAQKSPVLIVGDDDQSLYVKLKNATPEHIRKKHGEKEPDYEPFPLSYCSRSTEVIVNSINDFISTATNRSFLKGRVPKSYCYFPSEKMDNVGEKNPKIVFKPVYARFMSDFLKQEILGIAMNERAPFEVLIVVPNVLKKLRFPPIIKALKTAGFRNLRYSEITNNDLNLIDGLSILLEDPESNLGWRIMAKLLLGPKELTAILKNTEPGDKRIKNLVGEDLIRKIEVLLQTFQKLAQEEEVNEIEIEDFLKTANYNPQKTAIEKLQRDFYPSSEAAIRGIRDIKIHITTIVGSKGLSADYVFLLDFSDKYFTAKGMIVDQNIYEFIVAMTRARKKVYLISPDDNEATFLNWIKPERIDRQKPFLWKSF